MKLVYSPCGSTQSALRAAPTLRISSSATGADKRHLCDRAGQPSYPIWFGLALAIPELEWVRVEVRVGQRGVDKVCSNWDPTPATKCECPAPRAGGTRFGWGYSESYVSRLAVIVQYLNSIHVYLMYILHQLVSFSTCFKLFVRG